MWWKNSTTKPDACWTRWMSWACGTTPWSYTPPTTAPGTSLLTPIRKKGHPEGSIFWGEAGPLRNGKGSCYEAGVRVPCIVRWPGKVAAGAESSAIFATLDFLPTFANLTGFQVPTDRFMDGVDQTDLLLGKSQKGARETFLYQTNGVRKGKWKYLKAKHDVRGYAKDNNRKEEIELYDLDADIGETTNLATANPAIVEELQKLTETIIKAKVE